MKVRLSDVETDLKSQVRDLKQQLAAQKQIADDKSRDFNIDITENRKKLKDFVTDSKDTLKQIKDLAKKL